MVTAPSPQIETFPVGELGCNCSIVVDPDSGAALVIDPGGDVALIRERLEQLGAKPTAIVATHMHIDNVAGAAALQGSCDLPLRIHQADLFLYDKLPAQAAMLGAEVPASFALAADLSADAPLTIGGIEMTVIHTPGHTPGSVCFLVATGACSTVFSGDTLFRRGVGRTDLWGADYDQMITSIREQLLVLDDDTAVVTGHGPPTTIGQERRANSYLR